MRHPQSRLRVSLVVLVTLSLGLCGQDVVSRYQASVFSDPLRIDITDELVDRVRTGSREEVTGGRFLWRMTVVDYGSLVGKLREVRDIMAGMEGEMNETLEAFLHRQLEANGAEDLRTDVRRTHTVPARFDEHYSRTQRIRGATFRIDMYLQLERETRPAYSRRKVADIQARILLESDPVFDYRRRAIRTNADYQLDVRTRNTVGNISQRRSMFRSRLESEVRSTLRKLREIRLTNREHQRLLSAGTVRKQVPIELAGRRTTWSFVIDAKRGIVIDDPQGIGD